MALKYHFVMNMFYHPPVLTRSTSARDAVREILRYIEYRKATVVHMNNRMVAEWWDARHASTVKDVTMDEGGVRFTCDRRHDGGMVVKLAVPDGRQPSVAATGAHKLVREFGRDWLYVAVYKGESTVEVAFKESAHAQA